MEPWLGAAIGYIKDWLAFQVELSGQPGCIVAIAHRGEIVLEAAYGHANLDSGEKLTPRHRFRIASHTKAFTAAGIRRLREQKRLKLDDAVGQYVDDLHPDIAAATLSQLLSHTAGLIRDGKDSSQFTDGRSYLTRDELLVELKLAPVIDPNSRFKYSNHGYGLLGLVIEAITGEPYPTWLQREIMALAGLRESAPDMTLLARNAPFARGHSRIVPVGRRVVIPGDNPTHAIMAAAGIVATAADTARFFAQLAPNAKKSLLSVASRREMIRRQWRVPQDIEEAYYGLALMSGTTAGFDWFGHGGGFQGYISRTSVIPAREIAITVLTNAIDGWAPAWANGVKFILQAFATHGAPTRKTRDWTGRWWTLWGTFDLVPVSAQVMVANPGFINPFMDAPRIEVTGRDTGRIVQAAGYASHGEPVRRIRAKSGVSEIWLAGARLRPERVVRAEMERKYPKGRRRKDA
ncbi:serine hydrolase domain-containing protein [Bradyrhizobium sp. STM 3809]|uniref:serine hydrolase domain-containing protein n=1 Tax=Bradyrhizobium sp. STM 3809 TaxID=551936 RepID=UPI0002409F20|nr:serine hydrolase domain-containing protein [Bradyrhizobium sp. STM 3809]CCE03596.1 putative beta lactamase family protein; D-alanyl-D-alanine carboxypeptidase [Bradyrhizobium sp. STM 3809]